MLRRIILILHYDIIFMQQNTQDNNIGLYHKHIISDIKHLEKRANRFMDLRVEFIRQKCKPIEERIVQLKQQIKHEKNVQETSDNVMEQRDDIKNLRADVAKYQEITKYYQKHVDDLEKMLFKEEDRQKSLLEILDTLRTKFRGFKKKDLKTMHEEEDFGFTLTQKNPNHLATIASISMSNPKKVHSQHSRLPQIKGLSSSTAVVANNEEYTLKQQIQQKICSFNVTDRLIKDCLQVKKTLVQRMIGQLQSRLVKKKRLFVRICQAITQKQARRISREQFKQLDADQIFTLIISFPSLTRKFQSQLQKKRQRTTQLMDSVK